MMTAQNVSPIVEPLLAHHLTGIAGQINLRDPIKLLGTDL